MNYGKNKDKISKNIGIKSGKTVKVEKNSKKLEKTQAHSIERSVGRAGRGSNC